MSNKIQINDLSNPILTEFQRDAKNYGETLKVDLSSEAVIKKHVKILHFKISEMKVLSQD
jgi:3-isopropylmalate dehydratase small subunit